MLKILTDRDSDYGLRNAAATALGTLRAKRAVEPLLEMLNEGDEETIQSFVGALGKIGDLRARPVLIRLKEQESEDETEIDQDLLKEINEALAGISRRRNNDPLLALTDLDAVMRREAALVLGEEGDLSALPQLRKLLSDKDQTLFGSVSEAAVEAINKIEERELRKLRHST